MAKIMKITRSIFCLLFTLLPFPLLANDVYVGNFNEQGLSEWQEKSFHGQSLYQITLDGEKNIIKAEAQASASGLFRKIDVDLNKTPFINWSWKIDAPYEPLNEKTKRGDDYPARIYVVVSGGLFFWRTKAINYVWSSNQAIGSHWDNAYTYKAQMLAVRSGKEGTGRWLTEKRNVKADFKQLFGKDFDEINAVAIMTDSDDSKQSATAYYGDIFFTAE